MRILILLAIGLMLYIIISRFMNVSRPQDNGSENDLTTELVKCQYCGVHILMEEAVQSTDDLANYYCTKHKDMDKIT
jgi:uncharacterized protein